MSAAPPATTGPAPSSADGGGRGESDDRATVVATAVAVAVVVVAGAVAVALAERAPTLLADPGPTVRWLDPTVSAVGNLAAAVCIGALVLATVAIPTRSPAMRQARALAAASGVVWTLTAVLGIVTTYAVASGTPPTDPGFGSGLQLFVTSFEVGQYLLAGAVMAALATTAAVAASSAAGTAWAAVLALLALVPPALSGHSGSAADHETATSSMGMHLVGVSVWLGGLVAVGVLHRRLGDDRTAVVARYSGLALASAVLVVVSGVLNASTRLAEVDDVTSRYGLLVVGKLALTSALLGAGALHRGWTLRLMAAGRDGAFRRLLAGEVVVMAAVVGVAVALSTTAPPVSETDAPSEWVRAEVVAGYPVPPEPTLARWVLGWQPDVLWIVVLGAGVGAYLAGVRRLRRRGDGWPVARTGLFLAGAALLLWVTSGGPAVYGRWTFSAHMVQHMTLAMFVPVLLVGGAPVLLALRALQPRRDGSRGAREWLLAVVHSRYSQVITHPVVAGALFIVGMVAFYYSPLFSLALRTHLGHVLMMVHFLAAGYLFAWVLIGVDPGARRASYPFRVLLLFVTVAFHALFGVALLQGTTILAEDYFSVVQPDLPWAAPLLADQRDGAALAWGLGEAPMIVHGVVLASLWWRADTREARRRDRQADRDGDAERLAYNAYLAQLSGTAAVPTPAPPAGRPRRVGEDAGSPAGSGADTAGEPPPGHARGGP